MRDPTWRGRTGIACHQLRWTEVEPPLNEISESELRAPARAIDAQTKRGCLRTKASDENAARACWERAAVTGTA